MTFEKHLKKYLTGFWDKPKVRLQGSEKNLSLEEQSFLMLDRGMKNGLEEKMERALRDFGIPVVTEVIRFADKDRKIVEARTENGETVLASPNPFQAGVQAFIREENMTTPARSFPAEEPDWMKAPVLETLDDEPQPVVPATSPDPRPTGRFRIGAETPAREQPSTPDNSPAVPESTVLSTPASDLPVAEDTVLPVDYAALAQQQAASEAPQEDEGPKHTESATDLQSAAVATANTAPFTPEPVTLAVQEPVQTPEVRKVAQEQVVSTDTPEAEATPTEPAIPAQIDRPLQRFIPEPSKPPKKANLSARRKKPEFITIGQALIELGIDFDMNELTNPNIDVKLRREGIISEVQQYRAKALAHTLPFVDVTLTPPDPSVLHLLDEHTTRTERAFPYAQEDETFIVLTDHPARETLIRNKVIERTGIKQVEVRVTDPSTFERLINDTYVTDTVTREMHETLESRTQNIVADLSISADNAVTRFFQNSIMTGINNRASDIHYEQSPQGLQIRYRIDKQLTTLDGESVPANLAGNIIRVIKNMAGMDPNNNRLPQDNNIRLKLDGGKSVNLRVSTLPQHDGMEKVVIRLLKEATEIPEIEQLNLSPRNLQKFSRMLAQPEGIILVTGPTGSGKSFTLYSAIKRIATPERNVQTIEDPIEYQLPGINQSQINPAQQFTFAVALRSTMRQDPDVILLGEIRDIETAKAAIAAANTGHLVLSTLHTNDATSAIQRLRSLGVEDYNIEPSVRGVLAQRLVRRVCKECAQHVPTPEYFKEIVSRVTDEIPDTILEASDDPNRKCPNCNRGYRGMVPIHELLQITPRLRELIGQGATTDQLLQAAQAEGHVSLQEDAFLKVAQGITTIKEITKAISFQEKEDLQ